MGIGKTASKDGKAISKQTEDKVNSRVSIDVYDQMKLRMKAQRDEMLERESSFYVCGISGDPGCGKTGTAIDCRTEEQKKTDWVFILDFDEGAEPTWRQHWSTDEKVFILNPYIRKEDQTIDYIATADFASGFIALVDEAIETGSMDFGGQIIEVEGVAALVLDGLDSWLDVTNMIARHHHIKGADDRQADKMKLVPTQWFARNQEYNRLFDKVKRLKCHKFFITHMKDIYDGFNVSGQKPDWEKSTTAKLFQYVEMYAEERGKTTKLFAKVVKSKTNSNIVGKSYLLYENDGNKATWHGLDQIKNGML